MSIVIIESPYAGDIERNVTYARRAVRNSIEEGETPFASHLLYTQPGILLDSVSAERTLGIQMGYQYWKLATLIVFYTDYGWSSGMKAALERAKSLGIITGERQIGVNP